MRQFLRSLFLISACCFSALVGAQATDQQLLNSIDKVPPPPKTINDLIKVLDAAKPDLATIKKNEEMAQASPPANATREQLWTFYKDQTQALWALGITKKALETCKKTIEYVNTSNVDERNDALLSCVQADFNDGNVIGAIEKTKQMLALIPANQNLGWQMTLHMLLVNGYRILGDLDAAKNSMREIDAIMVVLSRSPAWTEWGDHWTLQSQRARGEVQTAMGQHVASELSYIRALSAADRRILTLGTGIHDKSTRGVYSKSGAQFTKAILLLRLGIALANQRKLIEAEYHYRLALKTFLSVGSRNSTHVSNTLSSLAFCLSEQGRLEESVVIAKYAVQTLLETGIAPSSPATLHARRGYAAALVGLGKYAEALDQFKEIKKSLDADPEMTVRAKRLNDLDEVIANAYVGKIIEAEQLARLMYEANLKGVGAKHVRTAWTQAFYGLTLQQQHQYSEANKQFSIAIPILTDQARNDSENQTISLKGQKRFNMLIESYIAVLAAEAKNNPTLAKELSGQAFQFADMARGSSVQRAMTQSTARSNIKDPKLEILARKEQDLQRRANSLNELLVALSSAPPERQLPAIQDKMKADIEAIKAERNSVKKDIENRYPEYFDLVEPKPITVARTARILKPNEVLITWYFGDQQSYVWAIHSTGLHSMAPLDVTKDQVAKDVARLRKALDPGVSNVDDVPPFDLALSHKLYTQLIKPVEASLVGKDLLISVPHAALGQLPIATLLTEPAKQPGKGSQAFASYQQAPWLMRKLAISQLPSVNALAALRGMERKVLDQQSFIAFADPYFSKEQEKLGQKSVSQQLATRGKPLSLRNAPKTSKVSSAELALLPALPDTRLEVQEIGQVLSAKSEDIYLHEQASVERVLKTDFSNKSIVMFSTHGLVPGELDGLTQPALALSSPDVTGEKEGDGLLTMDKILELKLNADWVVLSACNTASADGSSEALSGLGRAFFYAGAKALLVSNWPVDTVASRQLMTDLFKRQSQSKSMSKPESLRRAMLELADKGGYREPNAKTISYAYAHPLFWAPFVMVGD